LHADDRTQEDEARFRTWLAADRRHAAAFEHASATWDLLGGLGRPDLSTQAASTRRRPEASHSRRAVLTGGLATLIAGASFIGWSQARAGVYTTQVGEQLRLQLEDGTRVMLDTQTRIRFRASADVRQLELTEGRIDLQIVADSRPFLIDAGPALAERPIAFTRPARLDLRRDEYRLALTMLDGQAILAGRPTPLHGGQRIAVSGNGQKIVDRPNVADLTSWQGGRLVFRDETLANAAAEMNRYTNRPLTIADPRAAALRISGVYRVGDPEGFARSLALLLPVSVDRGQDFVVISSTS
jgi:transmembrane sensor